MVTKKKWEEFREIGLLFFINQILHIFGWAIVFDFDEDKKLVEVYPARVKFRGFGEQCIEEGYKNLSKYLVDNAPELYKEASE